jgi:putative lipoic acid-binding regulatory protein
VVTGEAALQFPTDYPVKIVGRPADDFRARVHAIMLRHAPALTADQVSERLTSRAQIEALVTQLQACDGVLMLL